MSYGYKKKVITKKRRVTKSAKWASRTPRQNALGIGVVLSENDMIINDDDILSCAWDFRSEFFLCKKAIDNKL